MQFQAKCILVKNMKPICFTQLSHITNMLCIHNDGQELIKIGTGEDLYSCMKYDHCRILTIITNGSSSEVLVLVFRSEADYHQAVSFISDECHIDISVQDGKLISYARSISDKLRIGTEVKVFDAQSDDNFVTCPACGVKNDKNSGFPFCLECGEPL